MEKEYITEIITDPEILRTKINSDIYDKDSKYIETPIRVEKHGNLAHKTETRIFRRDIHESYCDQEGCEFYGKHASQGNCWEGNPEYLKLFAKLYKIEEAEKDWDEYYKEDPDLAKNCYITTRLNWELTLDECIRLRAENARLKNKPGTYRE